MKTCASIFSGGGLVDVGAMAAGYAPIWAIEHDPEIAEVYRANIGAHVIVSPAQSVDVRRLESPDVLLASPPCQAHSNARSKKLEVREDAEVGMCVLDYVRFLRPRFLMIENVEGWKRSHSFKAVFHGLHELGYFVNVQVLNAADFGVPQTRRRLILRASREGWLPMLPAPVAWRGWYGAIEDLIPTLPESAFADWQLARLPDACV
jgi:DNA (cytosine-5)-methyltransferase 1